MAEWSTAFVNGLPDSCFLHVRAGGRKDSEGKTVPRDQRMFPVKDASGRADLPHLKNALARIPQSDLPNFGPNPRCYGDGRCRCRLAPTGAAGSRQTPPVTGGSGGGAGGGGAPPAPPGGGQPPSEPPDAARLDRDFAAWARSLTEEERSAIRRYQRHGGLLNDFLRGGDRPLPPDLEDEVDVLIERVDGLISRGLLRRQVTVWRGLDTAAFLRLAKFPTDSGFSSMSLNRGLITARYPVVIEITLQPGVPAAWLALASAPMFRRELELLLPRGVSYPLQDVRDEGGTIFVKADIAT